MLPVNVQSISARSLPRWKIPPPKPRVVFPSNTQPVIVGRVEARTEERLQAIRQEVEEWLRGQGVAP